VCDTCEEGRAMEKQLSLDLEIPITYETFTGTCDCGYGWEYQRCSIVRDMQVPCPECGKIIKVGEPKLSL